MKDKTMKLFITAIVTILFLSGSASSFVKDPIFEDVYQGSLEDYNDDDFRVFEKNPNLDVENINGFIVQLREKPLLIYEYGLRKDMIQKRGKVDETEIFLSVRNQISKITDEQEKVLNAIIQKTECPKTIKELTLLEFCILLNISIFDHC